MQICHGRVADVMTDWFRIVYYSKLEKVDGRWVKLLFPYAIRPA